MTGRIFYGKSYRIAEHYKDMLKLIFNNDLMYVNTSAVIVVEEDLLIAPDFYRYVKN